jgi:hypothetical protein
LESKPRKLYYWIDYSMRNPETPSVASSMEEMERFHLLKVVIP